MDHLIWICFNVFFAAFNGLYAVVNYRKAQGRMNQHMIWCLFQTALTLLCLGAAFAQLAMFLRS